MTHEQRLAHAIKEAFPAIGSIQFNYQHTAAPQTAPLAEWLSAEQAAEVLGIGYRTVLDLCNSGQLKSERVGRQIRIRRADLGKVEQPDDRGRHFTL